MKTLGGKKSMELLKLVGILVVVIGFVLKFDTMATVVVAGLVTGLVAGMSPMEILTTLGNSFISTRTATLFVLTLSAIGLCERNGLKDKAVDLIKMMKAATTGRVLALWQAIRTVASAFSLRIGGHPQFIRPLSLVKVNVMEKITGLILSKWLQIYAFCSIMCSY